MIKTKEELVVAGWLKDWQQKRTKSVVVPNYKGTRNINTEIVHKKLV